MMATSWSSPGVSPPGRATEAGPSPGGGHLYLLAGTPTPDGASGFPVRLYAAAGGRLVLARQVAAGLFSVANDLSGHLYVLNLGRTALSVIYEDAPNKVDVVPAPPQPKGRVASFSFYYPTWGGIAGGASLGVVYAGGNGRPADWTVTRIYAVAPARKARIAQGSWGLYLYFRYEGSPGGPRRLPTSPPGGTIENGKIMMPYTLGPGAGYLGPTPPFLPPNAGVVTGYPGRPRSATLVADTGRFFVFNAPVPSPRLPWPKTFYVLNKATKRWSVVKAQFYGLWPRLFGPWLATTVQEPNPQGLQSPGLQNERANEVDADTPSGQVREFPRVRGEYAQGDVLMPGKLLLQNLDDGRKVTIDTGQQDSEVLDVRSDGLVLYRVNDEIFSAQIEGDKLSAPTLVAKGEDAPEVHWAFWSNAPAEPAPGSKPPAGK